MEEKTISIQIRIANNPYPLNIKASDEEVVRLAVKTINDRLMEYKQRYNFKDDQDALSIILLHLMTQTLLEKQNDRSGRFLEDVKELDKLMEAYLESI
ncbi:MAG: cell division protein ZapA [Bacteroidales bacterium]|jgi:cell division protein ZapA|nr:cell division protein ZapA [Bacteroidales bacterium]